MRPYRKPGTPAPAAGIPSAPVAGSLRRLKWNEIPHPGDFVADGRQGFEPWEGPSGFQAGSFEKPIYRVSKEPLVPVPDEEAEPFTELP